MIGKNAGILNTFSNKVIVQFSFNVAQIAHYKSNTETAICNNHRVFIFYFVKYVI